MSKFYISKFKNKSAPLQKIAGLTQMGQISGTIISRAAKNRRMGQVGGKKIFGSSSNTKALRNLSDTGKSFSLKRVGTGVAVGGMAGTALYATV